MNNFSEKSSKFFSGFLFLVCFMFFVVVATPNLVWAQSNHGEELFRAYRIYTGPDRSSWEWFPSKLQYPAYLADPQRANFSFQRISVGDVDIPQTGSSRFHLSTGNRFAILRSGAWQLDISAGAFFSFDIDNSQDNIGWDGILGWTLSRQFSRSLVGKLEFKHQSSHRGDEFIERTGENRVDYTREDISLGLSYYLFPELRIYGEGGWATLTNNDQIQDDGRLQGGIEYTQPYPIWENPTGFYLAGDFQSLEETDWDLTPTIQGGFFMMQPTATWRFGLEYRNGHPILGEFIQSDEDYIGFGVWIDLFDPRNPY